MRTKSNIRSDTPEVTIRLAQIPGRVPEISHMVGYLGHGKEFREILKRPSKSMPKARILWFSIAGLVRLGLAGAGRFSVRDWRRLVRSRSARFTICPSHDPSTRRRLRTRRRACGRPVQKMSCPDFAIFTPGAHGAFLDRRHPTTLTVRLRHRRRSNAARHGGDVVDGPE